MSAKDIFTSVPHNLDAERSFVGGILAGNGAALTDLPSIVPDLCHDYALRTILSVCLSLHAAGSPVNGQTVSAAGFAANGGGEWAATVGELAFHGIAPMAEHFLSVLQEQLALRRLQSVFLWGAKEITGHCEASVVVAESQRRLSMCDPQTDCGDDHELPSAVADILIELDEMDAGKKPRSLSTPIRAWNEAFGGLPEGAFLALGGRPGTGKSAMMEQMITDLISDNVPVCVFERDMSPKKLIKRMACRLAAVPFWKLAKGYANREEREKIRSMVRDIADCPLRVHNPRALTADRLCAIVRREQALYGIKAVFLDHIQVLDLGGMELREGLTRASNVIRANATETGIPHLTLFHLNRNGAKGTRPTPEDVKEFDQLYGDVDGMAMLWSEVKQEDLKPGEMLPVKLYVAKNRDDGATENDLFFDGQHLSFVEAEKPIPSPFA